MEDEVWLSFLDGRGQRRRVEQVARDWLHARVLRQALVAGGGVNQRPDLVPVSQ